MKWPAWLNTTVTGAGIASFFGDLGYESVTVLLPSFLIILGAPVFALGIIEGLSDGASSFVKIFSGYFADKLGKRTGCRKCRILSHGFWMFVIYGDLWQTGAIPGSDKTLRER